MSWENCSSWRNPRVLLSLTLIFLCGVVGGAMVMRFAVHGIVDKGETGLPGGEKAIALERMTKELDLSTDQRRELETVLDDFVMYVQTLQAQMDEVRANGKQRILRILNDQQKQKFEKMLVDVQARQTARVR